MSKFLPFWVCAPGELIQERCEDRSWDIIEASKEIDIPLYALVQLCYGLTPLQLPWAIKLSAAFQDSVEMWLRLEEIFRKTLLRMSQKWNPLLEKEQRAFESFSEYTHVYSQLNTFRRFRCDDLLLSLFLNTNIEYYFFSTLIEMAHGFIRFAPSYRREIVEFLDLIEQSAVSPQDFKQLKYLRQKVQNLKPMCRTTKVCLQLRG